MNYREIVFSNVLLNVCSGLLNIHNYKKDRVFAEFLKYFVKDIKKYPHYTFDGRFENMLFEELNNSVKNQWSYYELLNVMQLRLEKLCVPCVILIPLNFIDDKQIKSDMKLSEDINLFKKDKPQITYRFSMSSKFKETPLEKYFKNNVYALLLRDHIVTAKDKNFFNFPLLTILINSIDYRVEEESSRIVEAVYTIIRMLDFEKDLENGGWGYMMHCKLNPANVYGVYYNLEGVTSLPKGDDANGYGHSFQFMFQPFLDVSTDGFLKSIDKFTEIISDYVQYCFLDKNKYTQEQLVKIAKWQNSFKMFNTAYELASQERYDNSLLQLLTILESLFIKNKGNKKEQLVLALQEFFVNDNDFTSEYIRENIQEAYKYRNKFVHEGVGVDNEYIHAKPLNSYQGTILGMKPFAHIGIYYYPSNIKNIINLFKITIKTILDYIKILS